MAFNPYVPSKSARGYNSQKCILCDRVPHYHVGNNGYCDRHKQEAIARRKAWSLVLWKSSGERERKFKEIDDRYRRMVSLKKKGKSLCSK